MFEQGQKVNIHKLKAFIFETLLKTDTEKDRFTECHLYHKASKQTEKILGYLKSQYNLAWDWAREIPVDVLEKFKDELEDNHNECPHCGIEGFYVQADSWHDCDGDNRAMLCLMCDYSDVFIVDHSHDVDDDEEDD